MPVDLRSEFEAPKKFDLATEFEAPAKVVLTSEFEIPSSAPTERKDYTPTTAEALALAGGGFNVGSQMLNPAQAKDSLRTIANTAPTGVRMIGAIAPPVVAAASTWGISTPLSMGLGLAGAALVERPAQWMEKKLGLRDDYSVGEGAIHVGTAGLGPGVSKVGGALIKGATGLTRASSPIMTGGQKVLAASVRGLEGAGINVTSGTALRKAKGEEITPGTVLVDTLTGFGFGAAVGYTFDEVARNMKLGEMFKIARQAGFKGSGKDGLRAWWRATQGDIEAVVPLAPKAKPPPAQPKPPGGFDPDAQLGANAPAKASAKVVTPEPPPAAAASSAGSKWVNPPPEAKTMPPDTELTTALNPSEYPVVEFPLGDIEVNVDIKQFKANGDKKTGVVEPLEGPYKRLGTAPIVIWEKLNGKTEVITGRHRKELAERMGETTIPAQVVREKDGFTKEQAIIFDAVSNIRDGQGDLKDYAQFFRQTRGELDPEEARSTGLQGRAKGVAGWQIGINASDDLYALYQNGKINDAKAVAIARGAPGNDAAQASAMRLAKTKTAGEVELYARNILRLAPGTGGAGSDQLGFEGISKDFAAFEAEAAAIAEVQAAKLQANSDLIQSAVGAAKRPEAARSMGLPVDDPVALKARIEQLRAENEKLSSPDAETFEMLRREAGLAPRDITPEEVAPTPPPEDPGQGGLFGDEGFTLSSEKQVAPEAPKPAPVDDTVPMFGDETKSTPPTDLDKRNAKARGADAHEIGAKVWINGDEITITTKPYEKHGGQWQDGVTEDGKTKTVKTPKREREDVAQKKAEYQTQQEGFSRLNKQGTVGYMFESGEVVRTATGRPTTPFPKVDNSNNRKATNTEKRVAAWLRENAIEEAKARGDDFNLRSFESENPARMPPATKDSMEGYLFDKDIAALPIPKPFLKPLSQGKGGGALNRGKGLPLADAPLPTPGQSSTETGAPPRGGKRDLPAYRADAPLLYRASRNSPYVQVPMGGLDGLPMVQMPELVRMVQILTGAKPQVKRIRRKLGLFRPMGAGSIVLDPRIARDPVAALKTLAHEFGHMLDYYDDKLMQRGNVLGHLAGARNHLITTLPSHPKSAEKALTAQDRKQIYNKARRENVAQYGPRPPKEGPKADPQGWQDWGVALSKRYRDAIEQEIKDRGLIKADAIRQELIDLSDYWKPYRQKANAGELPQAYIDYRESAVELYADALSVLFNSPATLAERAPLFYKGFFSYLSTRPEAYRAVLQVWELSAGKRKRLLDLRDDEIRAAARNGEEIIRRKAAEREAQSKSWRGWADKLRVELDDVNWPLIKREQAARKAGRVVPPSKSPSVLFEEFALADNEPYRYLQQTWDKVVKPLEAAGLSTEDYHLYLFYNRVLNEKLPVTPEGFGGGRSMVFNPGGTTPREAQEGLLNWRLNHGLERFTLMERADDAFRGLVDSVVRDAVKSGVYSQETYDDLIAPNAKNYAAFAVLDYLSESVPAGLKVGEGTFKDIANSFTATTLKMLNLRRWVQHNDTMRFTVKFMNEFAPSEIERAPTHWDAAKRVHVANPLPKDDKRVLIEPMVNGRRVGFYVPEDVGQIFAEHSPGKIAAALRPMNWFFREGVYPLWITFNPYFQLASGPLRDVRRSLRNMPGTEGRKVAAQFLANYGTLLGEAGAGAVRAMGRVPGLGMLKEWRPAVPMTDAARAARAQLEGRSDPLVNEMMANKAMGTPMDNFRRDLYNQEDALQSQMERLKLVPPSAKKWDLTRVLRTFLEPIERAGLSFEMLAKTAPYQVLRAAGASPREAANFVRNYTGVPNHRTRGRLGREAGTILPFFNVFKEGFKADARLALGKERPAGARSRTGWWLRYFLGSGMFAILKGLAVIGVLGEGLKRMYERIGDYDNTNYTTIPVAETAGGDIDGKKTMYLRVAEDETDRLLSGFIYKTILMAGGVESRKSNLLSIGASQVPSINPLLSLSESWGAYITGQNPRDGFRDSPVLTNDVWLEGGWPAMRDMLLWTSQETGVANFVRYNAQANTTLEVGLDAIPGLGRVLKISDQGLLQQQRALEVEEDKVGAMFRNSLPSDVAQLRRQYMVLRNLGDAWSEPQRDRYLDLSLWYRTVYEPIEDQVRSEHRTRVTRGEMQFLKEMSEQYLTPLN